jgi:hypothetical protein
VTKSKTNQTDLLLQQLLEAQKMNANTQPQGAITFGGINKYWPQLVGVVGLVWFLMGQAREQEKLVNRVATVETAVQSINQVKADQTKQTSDMQVLQIDVTAVKQAQKDQAAKLDNIAASVATIGQQVQSISQAIRTSR